MFLEWDTTPNPDARRIILPRALPLEYSIDMEDWAGDHPVFADYLLEVDGVRNCLLAPSFVTVTRERGTDWSFIRPAVSLALASALEDEEAVSQLGVLLDPKPQYDGIRGQIEELLAKRIAPGIAMDGGKVELCDWKDGIATVRLSGACGGCPSATITLKSGVEATLKRYVPEIEEVRLAPTQTNSSRAPFWKRLLEGSRKYDNSPS